MRSSEAEPCAANATTRSGPSNKVTRRAALAIGLSGCSTLIQGCGGGGGAAEPALMPPDAWHVGPLHLLVGSGVKLDLAATLPIGVVRGGTFEVAANGAALPAGMTLSPSGILAVGSARAGTVDGVIFSYTEPLG